MFVVLGFWFLLLRLIESSQSTVWTHSHSINRPTFPAATVPCLPPPQIPLFPQHSITTPPSMPPSPPLVHKPQSMADSPIEFPLLNELNDTPMGQIKHRPMEWSNAISPNGAAPKTSISTPSPFRSGIPFTGELQIAHPAAPNEREWVITAGNESAIDNVLAISLMYNGRLVSMGFFYRGPDIYYYAIMHKYLGPVFLKPNPYTYSELLKVARENEEVDLGLTQLCGQDNGQGKVTFSTYWERIPGVSFRIWFPGTREADEQKTQLEGDGFRLTSLCGYSVKNRAQYVGVWTKPALSSAPYEAYYGLTLKECLDKDRDLRSKKYVAIQFRVFNNGNEILCTAIWEHQPHHWHTIIIGDDLGQIYSKAMQSSGSSKSRLPRQISHFVESGRIMYVVLWSDLHTLRYPNPPEIWGKTNRIPVSLLRGTDSLLKKEQIDFIIRRIEHFMRDLDIPGLSIAISKDEKLKFAAAFGYGNLRKKELVTPNHQFRVGSVSKPITAAAILMLVDQGRLQLDQKLFGPNSLFGSEFEKQKAYGRYVTDLTIRNLLEHSSGGWNNIESDPAWLEPRRPTRELISMVLENSPLATAPGRTWIYSNFGYQLLGYVIERISGMSYEDFVKKNIWDKVGAPGTLVARSSLSEKSRREVLYYMSGNRVGFNPYEMPPPERTGPWGGWVASPIELLRLMAHFDGFPRKPDLLSERLIREWVRPTAASNETYGWEILFSEFLGLGWSVNIMGFNGWQHDGRMPGSAAMLVRLDNGLEMAVTVNKEYSERDFFHELGYILHHVGSNCQWWESPDVDLFQTAI